MYELLQTNTFKKDVKQAKKRGLNLELLDDIVTSLVNEKELPSKHKLHQLKGNFKGLWECHIQPDWLLIWKQNKDIQLLTLHRTGTHSDLF